VVLLDLANKTFLFQVVVILTEKKQQKQPSHDSFLK